MVQAGVDLETSVDAFLGGRVEAVQPVRAHHRSGLEAVLLAAALDEDAHGSLADVGAGAGVAGLCAAARCASLDVVLVERNAELIACAASSLDRSGNGAFSRRVGLVRLDIAAPEADRIAAGMPRAAMDFVVINPPFRVAGQGTVSPDEGRAAAHVLPDGLDPWFRFAAWSLRPHGQLVVVLAAESLGEALGSLQNRFGDVAVLPVHPHSGQTAHRVLLSARKGSRAPTKILPGLVLHGDVGSAFTADLDAILRGRADLAAIHPSWRAVG